MKRARNFQLPLSGSHEDEIVKISHFPSDFQLPLSGSLVENKMLAKLIPTLLFQLPLSGSLKAVGASVDEASKASFQLPLSGSLLFIVIDTVVEDERSFQLPLSGSQEIERSVVDLIDGVELSTPSLGITDDSIDARAEPPEPFFQLPLSGSQKVQDAPRDDPEQHPFNSLSRDHKVAMNGSEFGPLAALSTPSLGITGNSSHSASNISLKNPFNSLSRDHFVGLPVLVIEAVEMSQLSTPSLGITFTSDATVDDQVWHLLSTPSLGITEWFYRMGQ